MIIIEKNILNFLHNNNFLLKNRKNRNFYNHIIKILKDFSNFTMLILVLKIKNN